MKKNKLANAPLLTSDYYNNTDVNNYSNSNDILNVKKTNKISPLMLKNKMLCPIVAAMSTALISPMSVATVPVEFISQDWQVVCDNTRTCRLAGYQAENRSDFPVSILLIRRAGANAGVDGKVKIGGTKESSSKALMKLGNRHHISLVINDKDLGKTKPFSTITGDAELTASQVTALLDALTKSSKIELVLRNSRWLLSDKGATAVMLKADEAQGRVGTPSAFIRSDGNSKPNSQVLDHKPAPKLRFVVPSAKTTSNSNKNFSMKSSQLAALMKGTLKDVDIDCPNLTDKSPWRVSRLNETQLLAQHSCWIGAYNAGAGAWVLNDTKPYKPTLVTTDATDYADGKVSSVQKGRSLGDCLSKTEWLWTGDHFSKSYEGSTGLCRMIETGGAWQLSTYVSKVNII